MSEIVKIKLEGGFNKQYDPKIVGSGFIVLKNMHNLDTGSLKSRKGYGTPVTISGRNVLDMVWWLEPTSETLYWLGYDYNGSKQIFRVDNAFTNNENLEALTGTTPSRMHIYNYGNAVRFAKGLNHNVSVYSKIDRKYFNVGVSDAHFQFSSNMDTGETIQLVDTSGVTKIYEAINGDNSDQLFTGAVKGGSYTAILFGESNADVQDYDADTLLIRGLKSDGSTNDVTYYFEGDGTKATGQVGGGYTYVDISSCTSSIDVATEFRNAVGSDGGHKNEINFAPDVSSNAVYLRQLIAGSSGNTTITHTGDASITPGSATFIGGSSDTNILVCNLSDTSGPVEETATTMANELRDAIEGVSGHNGGITVVTQVDSDATTSLAGGVYLKQLVYTSTTGTTITVSGGFNDDCAINPPATFSSGCKWTFNDFYYDPINYPRFATVTTSDPTFVDGGTLPFTTSSRNVHYRISPIFDGVQEGLLDSNVIGPINFSGDDTNTVLFDITFNDTDYNPRLTGFNLYRAITTGEYPEDGAYYFIKTVNITAGVKDQWINSRFGYKGRSIFSAWDTDDFTHSYEPSTYTNVAGKFSVSAIGTQPVNVDEGDLYMDQDSASSGFWAIDQSRNSSTWRTTQNSQSQCTRTIEEVKKRFMLLDDDTYNDRFGEDRDWVIMSDNWASSGRLASRNGNATWGTFNSTTGLNVSNGSSNGTYYSYGLTAFMGPGGSVTTNLCTQSVPFSGFNGGELFYFKMDCAGDTGNGTPTVRLNMYIDDWTGGSQGSNILSTFQSWGHTGGYSSTIKKFMFKIPDTCTAFGLRFSMTRYADSDQNLNSSWGIRMNDLIISQVKRAGSKSWSHQSLWAVDGLGLQNDQAVGNRVVIDGVSYFVSNNIDDVVRNAGSSGFLNLSQAESKNRVIAGTDTAWQSSANEHTLTVVDAGLGDGAVSPLNGVTSLDTRYKVSDTVSGRTFGCNVNLFDSFGNNDEYNDMVIYSEIQQPDVLPISNYIRLNDLQGGAIVGVAGLMSDLVVFAERGIFRLNVPSIDPTGWSLVESEPNLGCSQPFSIKKWKNGVFFAGTDNIYYITPNFEFISISENWRDLYQSSFSNVTDTNQTVIEIDNNNERLIVKFGDEDEIINIMDLKAFANQKLIWYEYSSLSGNAINEGDIDHLIVRNDSKVYILNITDGGADTKVRELEPDTSQGESKYSLKTGYISLATMTDKEDLFIRRVNLHLAQSSNNCEITIYLNHQTNWTGNAEVSSGNTITKQFTPSTGGDDNIYSIRIGRRAKGFQLKIRSTGTDTGTTVLRDLEVEVD